MPDVKVYIRAENIDKWNAVENKAEWINTILSNSTDTSNYGRKIDTPVGPAVTVLSEEVPQDNFKQFLRDYSEVGVKKAPHPIYGYPCCHKKSPCKHWQWDELTSEWVNELTGDSREG